MSASRKILVIGGLALSAFGMVYGLHYALFVEHQTLDGMGSSLTAAFVHAAERDLAQGHAAVDTYARTKYVYVRQVDVHSHWVGLAMLLIIFGVVFDRVSFAESMRILIAIMLLTGSVVFPLGVLLQTSLPGALPSILAIAGSVLVIAGLAATAWGYMHSASS